MGPWPDLGTRQPPSGPPIPGREDAHGALLCYGGEGTREWSPPRGPGTAPAATIQGMPGMLPHSSIRNGALGTQCAQSHCPGGGKA